MTGLSANIAETLVEKSRLSRWKIYSAVERALFRWAFWHNPWLTNEDTAYSVDNVMSALVLPQAKVSPVKNALLRRAETRAKYGGQSSSIDGRRVRPDMVSLQDIGEVGRDYAKQVRASKEAAKTRVPRVTPEQYKAMKRSRGAEDEIGQRLLWAIQDAEARYQGLKDAPKYRHVKLEEKAEAREHIQSAMRYAYERFHEKGWV